MGSGFENIVDVTSGEGPPGKGGRNWRCLQNDNLGVEAQGEWKKI